MNNNIEIAYLIPDMTLAIKDLQSHIRIIVQSKGYEKFLGENICLSAMFLGKTMNTIKTLFKIRTDHIIDSLASEGIKLIKPKETSLEDLAKLE